MRLRFSWVAAAVWLAGCSVETHGLAVDGGPESGMDARVDAPIDGCVPAAEICNGADDDCDGAIDEPENLPPDPMHCGACGNACAEATPRCERNASGMPECVAECSAGLLDCDGMCVDPSTDPVHCGGCGTVCALPNATVACAGGACVIDSCMAGHGDCDGDGDNGCETDLTEDGNCGACGTTCSLDDATAACDPPGLCVVDSCDDGFGDCDGDDATGCETTLGTSSHCGSCGDICSGTESCMDGACVACPGTCTCREDMCGTGGARDCVCDPGCPCTFGCTSDCDIRCNGTGTMCTVDAVDANSAVDADCGGGATCTFDLRGQSNVTGRCADASTSCFYDCRDGPTVDRANCESINCESGARCRINCGDDTSNCDFEFCHADRRSCTDGSGDHWITCGTGACP